MPSQAVGFDLELPLQPAFRHDASERQPDESRLRQRRPIDRVKTISAVDSLLASA